MGQARQRGTREERIAQAQGLVQAREEVNRKKRDDLLNPRLMDELQTLSEREGQTLIPEEQILAMPYEKRIHLYQTAWKANHGKPATRRPHLMTAAVLGLALR